VEIQSPDTCELTRHHAEGQHHVSDHASCEVGAAAYDTDVDLSCGRRDVAEQSHRYTSERPNTKVVFGGPGWHLCWARRGHGFLRTRSSWIYMEHQHNMSRSISCFSSTLPSRFPRLFSLLLAHRNCTTTPTSNVPCLHACGEPPMLAPSTINLFSYALLAARDIPHQRSNVAWNRTPLRYLFLNPLPSTSPSPFVLIPPSTLGMVSLASARSTTRRRRCCLPRAHASPPHLFYVLSLMLCCLFVTVCRVGRRMIYGQLAVLPNLMARH